MNTFSVITVPADQCQTSAAIRVLPTQGMLASIVTTETGCGARNHPWVIEVEPSQKINLTLFDFFARESPSSSNLPCTEYVVLREDLTGEVESVCRGVERVRHIYTSTTNRLEVEFPHAQSNTDVYFAVYYEGEFLFFYAAETAMSSFSWWRHQMEKSFVLPALCAGNSLVTGEFPSQRLVTRSFDVFFDLRLNKRLSKQSRRMWDAIVLTMTSL